MFSTIDANIPDLAIFPQFTHMQLMLVSLGPSQVKEARSYYGEHARNNGIYEVEVCPELQNAQNMIAQVRGNSLYLLRGRIKSWHINRK